MTPGRRIVDLAAGVFGADVAARVFEPLVADWMQESASAPTRAQRALSQAQGWAALSTASLRVAVRLAVPRRDDTPRIRRGFAVLAAYAGLGAALQLPLFMSYADTTLVFLRHAILLAPALVGFSIPLAWLPVAMRAGVDARRFDTARQRWFLAGATFVCVLGLTALNGFVTPAANQAWREAIAGHDLAPGLRELPLPHLADAASTGVPTAARELRDKLVVSVAWPVALALFGWRLGRRYERLPRRSLMEWWALAAVLVAGVELVKHAPNYDQAPWAWPTFAGLWVLAALALRPTGEATQSHGR